MAPNVTGPSSLVRTRWSPTSRKRLRPTAITSSSPMSADRMRCPFTNVPLRLKRSPTIMPSLVWRTMACLRDTIRSSTTTSLLSSRPMVMIFWPLPVRTVMVSSIVAAVVMAFGSVESSSWGSSRSVTPPGGAISRSSARSMTTTVTGWPSIRLPPVL